MLGFHDSKLIKGDSAPGPNEIGPWAQMRFGPSAICCSALGQDAIWSSPCNTLATRWVTEAATECANKDAWKRKQSKRLIRQNACGM